jgi:bifunctional ADP-heptose synthase (sugar kinase/adenylyltransferase)
VVLFDEKSPAKLLENINPDVYTKGADYTLENLPERDIVLKNNIKVEFIEFVQGKSTTNVIKKINEK